MKICIKCNEKKPLNDFPKTGKNTTSTRTKCKKCSQEYQAEYRRANLEYYKAYKKAYRMKNPEKIKESEKKYIQKNRKKVNESRRKWIKENPEKHKASEAKYREKTKQLGHIKRLCPVCNTEKHLTRFNIDSKLPLGRTEICKICKRKYK